MNMLRRLIILSHRYLGIVLSLLVIMWFATGITMMYVGGMPRLTPETRLERMPVLDLNVLRLAAFELANRPDVPVAVVIDEAVELAKRFSTDNSGRFVNGVLAALAVELRPLDTDANPRDDHA